MVLAGSISSLLLPKMPIQYMYIIFETLFLIWDREGTTLGYKLRFYLCSIRLRITRTYDPAQLISALGLVQLSSQFPFLP